MSCTDSASRVAIDALIANFYRLFDNRNGVSRQLETPSELMTADVSIRRRQAGVWEHMDLAQFLAPRVALLQNRLREFHEWETEAKTVVLGDQAVRTSRYAKAGVLDDEPYRGSGCKCFMLIRLDAGWRIAGISWIDD